MSGTVLGCAKDSDLVKGPHMLCPCIGLEVLQDHSADDKPRFDCLILHRAKINLGSQGWCLTAQL